MNTIEDFLKENAVRCPDRKAVVCGEDAVTYHELQVRIEERIVSFRKDGRLSKGYAILPARSDIDFLVDYFAVHASGCVAVPVAPAIPRQRLNELEEELSRASLPSRTADILFTTGTTGRSKGVMIGHDTILANAENLIEAHGYAEDLNFLVCGPLNHLGSLSKVYPTLLRGGCLFILEGMKDINAFFQVFEYDGRFATFLVPSSIRMLLQIYSDRLAACASKLYFIETGAAPMTLSEMERLRSLLPSTKLFNTYASTEAGIVATYDFNCGQGRSGCVGRAMKNSGFRLSVTNHVVCSGRTLMSGYLNDEALTAEVLKDGEIYTSDLGEIDEAGYLYIKGREGDIINVGGYKISPSEIEEVAIKYENIADCICIAAEHSVIGKVLKLLVVMKDRAKLDKKDFYKFLCGYLESHQVPVYYEVVEKIARTYNGKLDRKHYV